MYQETSEECRVGEVRSVVGLQYSWKFVGEWEGSYMLF